MKKQRAIVYPYDIEFATTLRHVEMLNEIEVIEVISPIGWGLTDRNANYVCGGRILPYTIKHQITEDMFNNFDVLWIVESYNTLEVNDIFNMIKNTAKKGKDICITRKLDVKEYSVIEDICKKYGVNIFFAKTNKCKELANKLNEKLEKNILSRINTPIILILGMTERTNKFEIQLEVRKHLIEKGYKVCSIGSRGEHNFMGVHPFPSFMLNNILSESNKITHFNQYIKRMELEQKPDVFIIGVPGGLMPITKNHTAHYGIYAFEICNAISPDFVILSLHCNSYTSEYFTELDKLIKYKFNTQIDCLNIANFKYNESSFHDNISLKYIQYKDIEVDEYVNYLQKLDNKFFNIINDKSSVSLVEFIINKLSSYDELKAM